MSGLFKKKDKGTQISNPPLPDILPPMPEIISNPNNNMIQENPNNGPSTHDMIPNDISLNSQQPMGFSNSEDFSPDNLPKLDDDNVPPVNEPQEDMFNRSIPQNVEAKELPKLPPLPEIKETSNPEIQMQPQIRQRINEPIQSMEAPNPNVEDEVPTPPSVFSDQHFYDTPDEVRKLVEEKESKKEDYIKKYNLNAIEEKATANRLVDENPHAEYRKNRGPIFVDVESFRSMMTEIEDIKNNLKSSTDIMQHLTEIKNSKDRELDRWRTTLEDMQRKINYVDKIIFRGA